MIYYPFEYYNIKNGDELISKSLFLIIFTKINENTINKLSKYDNFDYLLVVANNSIIKDYMFTTLINIPNYNLVAKQLVEPINRRGLHNDFFLVGEEDLYKYIKSVDVLSSIISLN